MNEKSETKHAVEMRKLLRHYADAGQSISSLTKPMGRKVKTLKKWASRYQIRFNDFKPREKI